MTGRQIDRKPIKKISIIKKKYRIFALIYKNLLKRTAIFVTHLPRKINFYKPPII